jgi:hypothetical protein
MAWLSIALAAGPRGAQAAPAPAALPDWSGTWIPDVDDQFRQSRANPPPFNARAAKLVEVELAERSAGRPRGLFLDCLPEGMPSWMLISHNAMEILITPGRVTLLGESDGNRLRRIYTDGRGHPPDPDPSFHGHSVGHWDGDTLVVDTTAILPEALLAIDEAIGLPNNGDMHVVERIHLVAPDRLADDLEITAPNILTAPWRTTRYYSRQRGQMAEIVEGVCRQGDFAETKDADGNAVFTPLRQEGGNQLPPKP